MPCGLGGTADMHKWTNSSRVLQCWGEKLQGVTGRVGWWGKICPRKQHPGWDCRISHRLCEKQRLRAWRCRERGPAGIQIAWVWVLRLDSTCWVWEQKELGSWSLLRGWGEGRRNVQARQGLDHAGHYRPWWGTWISFKVTGAGGHWGHRCGFLNNNFICFFTFGCVGPSLLPGLLSSCGEWGCSPVVARGLLRAAASPAADHRLQGTRPAIVVARRLGCSLVFGIFPDQGSNPWLLHWQVDALPLSHQGSPRMGFWQGHSKFSSGRCVEHKPHWHPRFEVPARSSHGNLSSASGILKSGRQRTDSAGGRIWKQSAHRWSSRTLWGRLQ